MVRGLGFLVSNHLGNLYRHISLISSRFIRNPRGVHDLIQIQSGAEIDVASTLFSCSLHQADCMYGVPTLPRLRPMPHHPWTSSTPQLVLPSCQGHYAFTFSSKTSIQNGQSSARLDKSFTAASKKVRCDTVKSCSHQLTFLQRPSCPDRHKGHDRSHVLCERPATARA